MAAPNAPSITVSMSGTTATVTVDGDASVTNYVYYMLLADTSWTSGGNRSGDGAVTISGLTSGNQYCFLAVSKNVGNEYSLPSPIANATALSASDITVICYQNKRASTTGATYTSYTADTSNVIQKFRPPGSGRLMMVQIQIPAAVTAPIAAISTEFNPVPMESSHDR